MSRQNRRERFWATPWALARQIFRTDVYCHTLNNTVVASPRILIPLLELHQNADGTITIPAVLRPYMQGRERIEPRR